MPSPPPPGHPGPGLDGWLQRTIEAEIVPRLMDSCARLPQQMPAAPQESTLARTDVEEFTRLLLADDVPGCRSFVDALSEGGFDAERISLELFAPAARRLGVMWEEDACDFGRVTLGLWRMQHLVMELGSQSDLVPSDPSLARGSLLLATVPGADHTLGPLIVAEVFRSEGWDVRFDPHADESELRRAVRAERFDLIGISLAHDRHVPAAIGLIGQLRAASSAPPVAVMAGGPLLLLRPELVTALGADFTARDAREALLRASAWVGERSQTARPGGRG
jgi:methanogenic corrinoid protein MtbC1